MDVDETLRQLREHVAAVRAIQDATNDHGLTDQQAHDLQDHAEAMAELNEALDGWLSNGGFLPRHWQH